MSASWPEAVIGDVADLIRGVTYSKADASDIPRADYSPVLRATNIQESRLVLDSDLVFVPSDNISPTQRLRAGDIVVATSSGSKHLVGKSALMRTDWSGSFGAFCAAIRPKANVEARYLAAFLQSPSYWKQIGKKAMGVNINNLRRGDIESVTLPVPPIEEQRRIVAETEKQFSRLDEAVANLQRVKVNLKRYKAAVLKAAVEGRLVETEAGLARREGRSYETGGQLVRRILQERRERYRGRGKYCEPSGPDMSDLPSHPIGWEYATAEQLTDENRPITYGVIKLGDQVENGVPVLRSSDVRPLRIDLEGIKRISPSIASDYRRTFLEGGEVVMTVRGTLGGVTVVPPLCKGFNISREVAMLALIEPAMADVVASFIASAPIARWLMQRAKGIAYTGINIETLKALPLPIPPLAEQRRIVAEVDRRLSVVREVEAEVDANLQRAQGLRQATLMRVFSV